MTIFNWNYFNAESANKKSDITAGFLILRTPRKYLLLCSLLTFCCLQSVKDTKFESNSQLSSERIEIRVFSFRNASVKKGVGVRLILPTLEHCAVCFIPSGTLFRCHGRALGFYTFDRFITFYLPFMTFICHFFKIVNAHFIEIISKTSSMIILIGKFRHTVVPAKLPYYFYSFYHCSISLIYIMPSRSLGISGNRNFVPMSNRISYWLSESKIP